MLLSIFPLGYPKGQHMSFTMQAQTKNNLRGAREHGHLLSAAHTSGPHRPRAQRGTHRPIPHTGARRPIRCPTALQHPHHLQHRLTGPDLLVGSGEDSDLKARPRCLLSKSLVKPHVQEWAGILREEGACVCSQVCVCVYGG